MDKHAVIMTTVMMAIVWGAIICEIVRTWREARDDKDMGST